MRPLHLLLALSLGATLPSAARGTDSPPRFDAHVRLEPAEHRVTVELVMSLTGAHEELRFELHRALAVTSRDPAMVVTRESESPATNASGGLNTAPGEDLAPVATWTLRRSDGAPLSAARIAYTGEIHHAIAAHGEESARSFSTTAGIIDDEGVFLSGSSRWLPTLANHASFLLHLEVDLPAGWDVVGEGFAVSREQSDGRAHIELESDGPLEDAHLVAARFTHYQKQVGAVLAEVYLREPDPALATKYLEATERYLPMYATLLGPYPYRKFALVESFWETGYGMPSFTLLGSKVIRFPFILTSSYPHEILHDWWGNGVFVDYDSGNWCEGLTAYLADHMFKEDLGLGADYRRDALKRYADYVRGGKDFPLTAFRARHSPATEAVGYGKSLMLWHMIRREIGDDAFVRALRAFYQAHRFQRAGFADLERAFAAASGRDLGPMFRQWVERTGAPTLAIDRAKTRATLKDGKIRLELVVRQTQDGEPYALDVPIAIATANGAREQVVHLEGRESAFGIALDTPPLAVVLDPAFDVFRRLDRDEIAPSLGELFGAEHVTIVVPKHDPHFDASAWRAIAEAWSKEGDVQLVSDDAIVSLPPDRAVWLLGRDNRFASAMPSALDAYEARVTDAGIDIGRVATTAASSVVVVVRRAEATGLALGWITAQRGEAIPGLARKLPHYGKYSYLGFSGDEPTNVAKGQWPATRSPLVLTLVPGTALPEVAAREPLAKPAAVFDQEALLAHVRRLADPALEGRAAGSAGAHSAADYIAQEMAAMGLVPGGDGGGFVTTWRESSGPDDQVLELRNVIGVIAGRRADWSSQSVVLGAHYDHLGRGWPDVRKGDEGRVHPGADDNASGIAVLLEVARTLVTSKPSRTILIAAYDGEEWGRKGSKHHVAGPSQWPAKNAIGMVALDAVGRLGERKPMLLGVGSASEWQHIARGIGFTTGVESQLALSEVGASDHQSFLEVGVPAIQLFAGAHDDYHRPTDTADKIDTEGMVKIATLAREAVAYLAERETPLTSTLATTAAAGASLESTAPRRASLGTMPDFAFTGPGVRVESVMAESPAATAGLADGDILLAIDDDALANLKGYSDVLKKHAPGDRVRLKLRRGEQELELTATLGER